MDTLTWQEVSFSHDYISPVRYLCNEKKRYGSFVHDFYEFFWIDDGVCIHDVQGEGSYYLQTNDLSIVHPGQAHEFVAVQSQKYSFNIICILINSHYLEDIIKRYPEVSHLLDLFYSDEHAITLSIPQKERLSIGIEQFYRRKESKFEDDLFILNLFNEINITQEQSKVSSCPKWLQETIKKMHLQKNFSLGSTQFETISGRCYEHITRLMKKHLSITPNQLLQQYRMEYAANRLRTTNKSILEIAFECGYNSISQFYKVFYSYFNTTPNKYRYKSSNQNLKITTLEGE